MAHSVTRVILLASLVLAAGCAAAPPGREAGPPRSDSLDLVAVHTAGAPERGALCLACHGDIMKRTTLNPRIKEAHAAMIPFLPDYDTKVGVTNATCASCHAKVDVVQHSAALIRKNVDVGSCEVCHGKTGPASKKFYAN